jgi:competence protein ComEA
MQRLLLALGLALCSGIALAAVNINTATKDELVSLPGIGPAKAQAILDYRKAHGAFKSVEELKDVKGIGAKRFEKLKPELAVSGPTTIKEKTQKEKTPADRKGGGGVRKNADATPVVPAKASGTVKP